MYFCSLKLTLLQAAASIQAPTVHVSTGKSIALRIMKNVMLLDRTFVVPSLPESFVKR